MKLMAGALLFLLCALAGEGQARRLAGRERCLARLYDLIREIGDRQLTGLVSFREGLLLCPPSPEREQLLTLLNGKPPQLPLLTDRELAALSAYARARSRSLETLRAERDALLALLQGEREQTHGELRHKGQVYRSVGYLGGVAALLLVL